MNPSLPDPDQYALVCRNLDRIFDSLTDDARSGTRQSAWSMGIGLMALRFIAADPTGPDKWAQVVEPRAARPDTTHLIYYLASQVEQIHPELSDVFSRGLLSGLERLEDSLLREWTFQLSQISRITVAPSLFGRWVNAKLATLGMQAPETGESSTPPSVARLMVELAEIPDGASVFDPCCGHGMILASAVEWASREGQRLHLFGQEISPLSWAICRLRLFLIGQDVDCIELGDSLREPAFVEDARVRRFDRVFCDSPLGMTLRDSSFERGDIYKRFVYGLPGKGNADNAFVQHAVASMKPDGRAVVLLSHGFLFRGGPDGRVREGLVESRLVEAVIGLPAKLKPGTAIETALVVFGKNSSEQIVFIDASRLQPNIRGRAELSGETVGKIVGLLRAPVSVPDICRIVPLKELLGDANLLPRRHITPLEGTLPSFEVTDLQKQVHDLEAAARGAADEMDRLIPEISKQFDGGADARSLVKVPPLRRIEPQST